MIMCHVLMISLFIIFVSQYLGEQRPEKQTMDPEERIQEAIRRLKRDSSTSDIKQRRFERHLGRTAKTSPEVIKRSNHPK